MKPSFSRWEFWRESGWRPALSLLAGFALAFAYPKNNLPLLGWIALAGLLFAVIGASPVRAALCGWLFGVGRYTLSLSWIATVLQQYGPMPFWQAAGVFTLMVVVMSLFEAAFAAAVAWIARRSINLALLAVPFLWVAMEFARMYLPQPTTNFPWNLLGYTASPNLALAQIASITGIFGLSFLVAGYNALIVWAFRGPHPSRAVTVWLAATGALALIALFGGRLVPRAEPTRIATLVQTNLPQALDYPPDWNIAHAADLAELDAISISPAPAVVAPSATLVAGSTAAASATAAGEPGLVVWPEVPAPFSLQQGDFAVRVARIARASHSDFLFGEIDWKQSANGRTPYNSAALFDPQGRELFLYDKIHLVPFGEFIPWRNALWFARNLTGLIGDFGVGNRYAVGDLPGGHFAVFICYEAIFPYAIRHFVSNGAGLLVNISNDGWFGRSAAPAQHLAQARVRAIENRRWMLRDTNNGFTVSIDPYGRTAASMPAGARGRLAAPYAFRNDLTLYTRWGDWVAWLSVIASACFLLPAALYRRAAPVAPVAAPASRGPGRGSRRPR